MGRNRLSILERSPKKLSKFLPPATHLSHFGSEYRAGEAINEPLAPNVL